MAFLDHFRSDPPSPGGAGTGAAREGASMSFLEHLEELRRCIFRAMAGVLAAFIACFFYADRIYGFMERPLTRILKAHGLNQQLVYHNPIDPFNLYVKLALICGLFVASPWIFYQVWSFIRPGLYPRERRYVVPFVVGTSTLFILGGVFAYHWAFPIALNFLIEYAHRFTPLIEINEYFSLFATVVLGLGLVFELPTLIFFLSLLGVVNARFLVRNFRYAILVIAIVALAITPTSDITTFLVFAAPMVGLYVLGIGIAYIFGKDRRDRRRRAVSA
ncbi:MAG TPA: twin-arginine translocase subunit TatC [Terriglobales bacterium]|nr:twin-arginine translocase subunit TatC [Terriglobales bacterium]